MASLGTQAIFIHPTEAVHGDMGAITSKDLILAVSHSGNSEELLRLLESVKKWLEVDVIAIAGRCGSAIDHFATVILDTGITTEACALGLAPTSSSTAALAVGDALAVCASLARGVRVHDFARRHPFGSLGRQLYIQVKEIMRGDYPKVHADMSLDKVLNQITQGGLGLVIVDLEKGDKGIITDGDIRRTVQSCPDWATKKARDVVSSSPVHVHEDACAFDALALMESKKITSLVVVDNQGYVIGVTHIHDILSPISQRLQADTAG
jgi:arabinose-5-phosphate isomerase